MFRGGCFFAAASAEFDSRPGAVRDRIVDATKAWLAALQEEVTIGKSRGDFPTSVNQNQLAFELHAYVQEANWAFKLFNDRAAFAVARRAIADRIERAASGADRVKPERSR